MPTTIRDQIIESMLTRLKTVNAAAQRTYLRLLESDLPAACLWDQTESGGNAAYGKQSHSLQINVAMSARLAVGDSISAIANEMLGQLLVAMISTDQSLGGLADAVRYQSSTISYPEPGNDWIIGIDVVFNVDYKTTLGNPYLA